MAEEKNESAAAEGGGKKKRLLLMIVAGALALVIVAGTAIFLLMKKGSDHDEGDEAVAEESSKKKKDAKPDTPPVFVKLEALTVKLQPAEGQQMDNYLQAMPELRVLDGTVGERVKLYMPEIRHRLLLILSGKKAADLSSPQGVEQLSVEMRNEINAIIAPPKKKSKGKEDAEPPSAKAGPDDPIQAVLFTSFIIQ